MTYIVGVISVCMTDGCKKWAEVWVTRQGRDKYVCKDCSDWMTWVNGWFLL